jgi:hypothetical protein
VVDREGNKLYVIQRKQDPGIDSIALNLKDIMKQWGTNIEKIAMNSIC